MKFISTRKKARSVSLSEALERGLAEDGGLYIPEKFPHFDSIPFKSWPEFAEKILSPFFEGDHLESFLGKACKSAFSFPLPLKILNDSTAVLELFHGPTAAFKD
ncbi:MAG: thrC, partial [Bacteriovoracaceae bacterium]|nr:thrC [Bacteriovoracaceae bacterium]